MDQSAAPSALDEGPLPAYPTALGPNERQVVLDRLQRKGAALTACECSSRNWLPPDSVHELPAAATWPSNGAPGKLIVPITYAACGLIKLYDPAVVGALTGIGA
jgi:hypothetical protein